MASYNHSEIEKKWQNFWEQNQTFATGNPDSESSSEWQMKPKFYTLDMFPYPSGAGLHVGHPEGYTANDIIARYKHARGFNVLHPMGWDAFGLPAENYAIKTGVHPSITTAENIATFKRQIKSLGFSYDWNREIDTTDPKYYQWTQWIFLKLFEHGLAYEQDLPINYCPSCKTGLANEEVVQGRCERCDSLVEKKKIRQWVLAITKYADRLEKDVEKLDWPRGIKDMQINWIGRSEGCQFTMVVDGTQKQFDTLYLASGNQQKLERLKKVFSRLNPNTHIEKYPFLKDVQETGKDSLENANQKMQPYLNEKRDFPIITCDSEIHFEGRDFDATHIKREALKSIGKTEEDCTQQEVGKIMNDFYRDLAAKNGGKFDFYYIDSWVILFPSGEKKEYQYKRFYTLTDTPKGELDAYFPMRNLYISQNTGKYAIDETEEDFFIEFTNMANAMKSLLSDTISVYTTRIDTVFGMTYAVIAPDHKDTLKFLTPEQKAVCEAYIAEVKNKADVERTAESKEKTGVFTGNYVVNPFNGERVPLWIADYVLGNYGTGAVMAVPAHDERDYEFAKKFGLEIKNVIAPHILMTWKSQSKSNENILHFNCVTWIIRHWNEEKYLLLKFEKSVETGLVWGSIEEHETPLEAIKREVSEETWYTDFEVKENFLQDSYSRWYKIRKNREELAKDSVFFIQLNSDKGQDFDTCDEHDEFFWFSKDDLIKNTTLDHHKFFLEYFFAENRSFYDDGILVNSWEFSGLTSKEARIKLTDYAEKNGFGEKKINYKLRDWLFSRQRYWGEPIPLIHLDPKDFENLPRISDITEPMEPNKAYIYDKKGTEKRCKNCTCGDVGCTKLIINGKPFSKVYDGIYTKIICDYNLPLKLPEVQKYEPAGDGQSPLATVPSFVNVQLADNLVGKRETNTMPQWGGSCWYYLRFMDPKNPNELVNKEVEKYWGSVDSYVGGAEHAVLHLLYARFWHKFLFDINVVSTDEPFYRLRNQGMILGLSYKDVKGKLIANDLVEERDGKYFSKETGEELTQMPAKMSKSLKNVINPDDVVREYGADTLRLYEMAMWDFKDTKPWDTKAIIGVRRFLEKVWRLYTDENPIVGDDDQKTVKVLHKTIKKVGEDIEEYRFNTALSQMMICVNNGLPKDEILRAEWKEVFLKLLHPFAPHITEELWSILGKEESIFFAPWPVYDEKLTIDDTVKIGVQVSGKVRGDIEVSLTESQESAMEKVTANPDIQKWVDKKEIIKIIYIPWRILNIVVK